MQRGFTENTSSVNAALLVSEAITECRENKQKLFFTTLDAEKAFDVVCHDSLFRRLYLDGVQGDMLLLLLEMYNNSTTKVKWGGNLSEHFNVQQGVRQGSPLSTILYKRYNNKLLENLQESGLGFNWGNIACPAPTCADDVALLSTNEFEHQSMLYMIEEYTHRERYNINGSKSSTLVYHPTKGKQNNQEMCETFTISGEVIPEEPSTIHLGIHRDSANTNKITLDNNIRTARRALYALMGAGLHGKNGLGPVISINIFEVYITPRCLYGLEALQLTTTQLKEIDSFQRNVLRQLQSLPERPTPANIAIYALSGKIPYTAIIEKRMLTLFGNIARQKHSIEYKLAIRQLVLRDFSSKSWFCQIRHILTKYELPSAFDILEDSPPQIEWKRRTNQKINEYWEKHWQKEHQKKSSLKYLNIAACKVGKVHQVWSTLSQNVRDVRRATIKVKLLTGTYTLQANRAVFNQHEIESTCPLCQNAPETREHFLAVCPTLSSIRDAHFSRITTFLFNSNTDRENNWKNEPGWLTQLILDCTHPSVKAHLGLTPNELSGLEGKTRDLCFALHAARSSVVF